MTPVIRIAASSLDRQNSSKMLEQLKSRFDDIRASGVRVVSVDLRRLGHIDVAGARCLLEFWAHVASVSEVSIQLTNVSENILPTLTQCKLLHIFGRDQAQ